MNDKKVKIIKIKEDESNKELHNWKKNPETAILAKKAKRGNSNR